MAKRQVVRRAHSNPVVGSLQKALALQSSGKIEKAQRIYKSVLKKQPRNADATHLLGVTYRQLGYPARAIDYIQKAIELSPNHGSFYANLARAQADLPDVPAEEVLDTAEKALKLDPKQVEAVTIKALSLVRLDRVDEAEKVFKKLIAEFPGFKDGYRNYGKLLLKKEKHADALAIYNKLILVEPDNADNLVARALCLLESGDFDSSELELMQALERFPDHGELKHTIALCMDRTRQHYKGLPYAEDAVRDDPKKFDRHVTLGLCQLYLGRPKEALKSFGNAKDLLEAGGLSKGGVHNTIDWNISLAYMAIGDFEKGWELHDARLEAGIVTAREFDVPLWKGEDISDKTILVWQDQGIGDAITSGVMLHDLVERAGKLIYEGAPKTIDVFRRAFPEIECRAEASSDDTDNRAPKPDYDCQICVSDLGRHFRRSLEAYAQAKRPAFKFDQVQARGFLERLGDRAEGPIVGVSWRSQNLTSRRMRSYLSAPDFSPVMEFEGVTYINLQYVSIEKELDFLTEKSNGNFINFPDVDLYDDLDSAMSLSAICDIVVAANTSAAVLPAVLDVPVLSWGGFYYMPLLDGKYIPPLPSTHYFRIGDSCPTKEIILDIKDELGRFLDDFSPNARNERLGIYQGQPGSRSAAQHALGVG